MTLPARFARIVAALVFPLSLFATDFLDPATAATSAPPPPDSTIVVPDLVNDVKGVGKTRLRTMADIKRVRYTASAVPGDDQTLLVRVRHGKVTGPRQRLVTTFTAGTFKYRAVFGTAVTPTLTRIDVQGNTRDLSADLAGAATRRMTDLYIPTQTLAGAEVITNLRTVSRVTGTSLRDSSVLRGALFVPQG